MKSNLPMVGRWSLIVGIILAILAGFTTIPYLLTILFVLGLIVGFLNIKEKESTAFLVGVVTLLLIGVGGLQLGKLTPLIASILENFITFVAAAGLIVALKQVLAVVQPQV